MLKVNINDLTFLCIIGILPKERLEVQRVIVDISFEYFYNDDGSNFIDYSEISSYAQKTLEEEKFQLIEDAILYIRKYLKANYEIKKLKVKITKPDIISNCVVSVEE
jgi:dihydroneopterin aldolase